MITIIRNADVYKPEHIGVKDVLLLGNKIAAVDDNISIETKGCVEVKEIDGKGKSLVPGFIDCHVHILGGGGEGGFATRTPEVTLTGLTSAGVTVWEQTEWPGIRYLFWQRPEDWRKKE